MNTDGHRGSIVASPTEGRDQQTFDIIGAAMEVHNTLGPGFLEPVYQEALAVELGLRGVPFVREAALAVSYKGVQLQCAYKADFVCFGEVILELKALGRIDTAHHSQLLNYLKATGLKRGLLINFGTRSLETKRLVR